MDQKTYSLSSRGPDHRISKTTKNTNNFSILNWIPRSSRGITSGNT
ncbi:proline/betaine transporter [Rickettsia australis]|nr:proline/betaine transporter [Rickettsia australis]